MATEENVNDLGNSDGFLKKKKVSIKERNN